MSLHISENVIFHETADGISLYHIESGEFRSLNATAAQIWTLLSDHGDRAAVVTRLSLMYSGGNAAIAARIKSDVDTFVDSMVSQGMLVEAVSA